jgi:mannose-6-phosphate isomerase-like protein (cupin superfamily)
MSSRQTFALGVLLSLLSATAVSVDGGSSVTTRNDLQWNDLGNGIKAAVVSGDMAKGPSRFFLSYPAGLITPKHHHDADHYVTMISGKVTLTVDGKEHALSTGSYFALTGGAVHVARVEGDEPAVFFIQADGPWNVVFDE